MVSVGFSIIDYNMFKLFFITNNPEIALIAEKSGIDRVWIDLEVLGKEERQKGLNTVKSKHIIKDIGLVSEVLSKSKLMVRINPWNDGSKKEIDTAIKLGAQIIMLPYWKTMREVEQFIDYVDGRVITNLLLETKEAVDSIDDVLKVDGIDEIHIGLNDLRISYGSSYMFEPYSNGLLEKLADKFNNHNISFGVGGIGRIGSDLIPTPEQLLIEQYRIGSSATILSRSFCDVVGLSNDEIEEILFKNVRAIREIETSIQKMTTEQLDENHRLIVDIIKSIINKDRL